MQSESVLMDVLREGLWTSVILSAPILTVALVVGLVIGLFQALTSVQEMTLTFVPKLGAILIAFWVSLGLMSRTLTVFYTGHIVPLIAGGGL
ncbi:MAG: flagellar biosynthetic protein FliQ [Rhodobacteraceae bacterium]|nr:flagellar biosynthetic protein FliQ [Paracoccaceae bacterium]